MLITLRLRQNLQVPTDGRPGEAVGTPPESQAGKTQQYLRLPVESAKKLRWYDRPDLNHLVQQNLREKNDLFGVNAALRQVSAANHINEVYLSKHDRTVVLAEQQQLQSTQMCAFASIPFALA